MAKPQKKQDQISQILDERESRYGNFVEHAAITQVFKEQLAEILKWKNKKLPADMQESLDMIFHKIGRIVNGDPFYADSWIDIAGYAKLVSDRLQQEEKLNERTK
jgi:predicted Co/Zn/Cd cation transporter (cation efflux family)